MSFMVVKNYSYHTMFSISVMLIMNAIIFKIIAFNSDADDVTFRTLSVLTIGYSILVISSFKKVTKTYFSITLMFVILFILFMFGQSITWALGVNETFLSEKFTYLQSIDALTDAQLYLGFFLIGVSLSKKSYKHLKPYQTNSHGVKIGLWIVCLSLPFELWVSATKIYVSTTFGYAALYQDIAYNMIPSSVKILSYFFLPGVWYLYFCSPRNSKIEKVGITLLLWGCISYLLMGYRAMSIIPILLYLYARKIKHQQGISHSKHIRKKPILLYIVIALIIIFVFPAVRYSRNSGGLENMNSDMFNEIVSNNEIFATINDMGKSIQTVIYTKDIVPEKEDFRYGYSYVMAASVALPNLFWEKHPAEVYGSLGRWITKIVDSDFYDFGGALGYSCVAESYVNFGYVGIIICPLIFGFLLFSIEKKVYNNNNPIGYASLAIVAFYLLFYPRGEFSEIVRGIAWYMFIPYCIYKLTISKHGII